MKRKYIVAGTAAVLILAAMAGKTMAAFSVESEPLTADISVKSVGVSVVKDKEEEKGQKVMPGSIVLMPRAVKNDVPNGYDIYVKVVIYHRWEKQEETHNSADEADVLFAGSGEEKISLYDAAMQNGSVNNWIVQYADEEQVIMYYTKPLAPNELTTDFLEGIIFEPSMGNEYANAVYHLEYEVTAVQANNAKDAIAAELGVFMTFDANGTVVDISETNKGE